MRFARTTFRHALAAAMLLAPAFMSAQGPVSTGKVNNGTNDLAWRVSVNSGTFFQAFLLGRGGGSPPNYQWIGASASGSLDGGAADGNRDIVANDLSTHHGHGFTLRRIDFARHD